MEADSPEYRDELYDRLHASLGSLVPAFVHSLNNCLVGVMGNIDLAGLYGEDPDTASARIDDARKSALRMRDFLTELTRYRPVGDDWTRESYSSCIAVAGLACGRSLDLEADDPGILPERLGISDLEFRTVLLALLAWAIRSCAGTGKVRVLVPAPAESCVIGIEWECTASGTSPLRQTDTVFPEWAVTAAEKAGAALTGGDTSPGEGSAALTLPVDPALS
jgi:hypothetical protein